MRLGGALPNTSETNTGDLDGVDGGLSCFVAAAAPLLFARLLARLLGSDGT